MVAVAWLVCGWKLVIMTMITTTTFIVLSSGRSLGGDWRRRPGRPRVRWTDQLRNDTGSVPANLYGAMVERRDGPSWLRDDDDIIAEPLREFTRFTRWIQNTETAPGGRRPLDQANRLEPQVRLYGQPVNHVHRRHLLSQKVNVAIRLS